MSRWDSRTYRQIENAMLRGNTLLVQFKDGSLVEVPASRLLPPEVPIGVWQDFQVNPNEIRARVGSKEFEISWNAIRLLTDSEYSSYVARKAEEQAKTVGMRIRAIREGKGLSSKDLAHRAGISAQSLSRIETGKHDVVFTTLQRILAAMGATLRDLAEVRPYGESSSSAALWTPKIALSGSTPEAPLTGPANARRPSVGTFHEGENVTPSNTPGRNTPGISKVKAA